MGDRADVRPAGEYDVIVTPRFAGALIDLRQGTMPALQVRDDQIPALRDALAPHDERVQGPGHWRVDRNGHGEVALWRFRHEDDQIPTQHALRPHLADRLAPPWIVWRATLAGLGIKDVK